MKRLSTGLAATFCLFWMSAVQAGTYQAMCGGTKCNVYITGKRISTPYGNIPAKRVTQWGLTGKTKTNMTYFDSVSENNSEILHTRIHGKVFGKTENYFRGFIWYKYCRSSKTSKKTW